mgnify:CR=1 FL=1
MPYSDNETERDKDVVCGAHFRREIGREEAKACYRAGESFNLC